MNRKLKIGISLLVAMAFVLPAAAIATPTLPNEDNVLGQQWGSEADIKQYNTKEVEDVATPIATMQNGELVPLTEGETDGQLFFENPAGDMFKVVADDIIPNEDYYQPWMKITTDGGGPYQVEPELEIYNWEPSTEEIVYETSFEDNARNYMEWGQIDGDCVAPGGYYDGWTWSDARACGSEHSFKNTMYDEYKNMQDDYLYLKECVDISGNYAVNISFDTFVAGEYAVWYVDTWGSNLYNPLDFLSFGIIDAGMMYFVDNGDGQKFTNSAGYLLPGNYYFFDTNIALFDSAGTNTYGYPNPMDYTSKAAKIDGCSGWWHVWLEFPVSLFSTPDCMGVWFNWMSDKERVFEGAYIDNVQISTIAAEGEKIYQGHSQQWMDVDGTTWFEFPLEWDDVEPGTYKAIAKLKNDDADQFDIYEEIIFEVGDQTDCEITDLVLTDDFSGEEVGETIDYTTDVHVTFTTHNNGNIGLDDIPVKATAYKQKTETLLEYDFEGMPPQFIGFVGGALPYKTSDYAFSGSSSLAFNDPNTLHYGEWPYVGGLIAEPINMKNVGEAYLDHYIMGKLGTGDEFDLVTVSETSRYAYLGGTLLGGDEKIDPWMGPMQPQCNYQQVDLAALWETYEILNENLDANGHPTYNMYIGYLLINNGDEAFYYPGEFDWSGVYIDDISVTASVRGEAAWSDQMMISGCDPSESCTKQFVWEDVPYSCYELVVETVCDDDVDGDNDAMVHEFCVMENLEKMAKADFVDYTECSPEAWCVSDVVGNDCANDHYALATNCDTHAIPAGVNDYIALGPGDDCNGIDIGHLTIAGSEEGGGTFYDFESGDQGWTVVDGDGNPANWELGNTVPGACEEGGAMGSWFFIDDDDAGSGAGCSDDNWLISPSLPGVSDVTFHGDFQDMAGDGELTVKASTDGGSTWSDAAVFTTDVAAGGFEAYFGSNPAVSLPTGTNKVAFHYTDDCGWAWGAIIDNVQFGTFALESTDVLIEEGFESGIPSSWTNTGWLLSYYGSACEGTEWAYSWAAGDELTTPTLTFEDETVISFQNAVESSTHPMDLEVWLDYGTASEELIWSDYGYTHVACELNEIILGSSYAGDHTITWLGLTSDFYGQIVDDVLVTTESEPEVEGDQIFFNATYQVDMMEDYAPVILEIAGAKTGECGDLTLVGTDDYGDGWTDYSVYSTIDVLVNGVAVIEDFTVTSSTNEETFTACDGDTVEIVYNTNGQTSWLYEHAWYLLDAAGNELAADGVGGVAPAEGTTEVPISIGGGVCSGCEAMECVCPPGVTAWTTVETFAGNTPGVCQEISVDLAPFLDEGDDTMCIRLRLDTTAAAGMPYAGPGIGFHLHEYSISDVIYDELMGTTSDFVEDWEDGVLDHEPGCVTYGEYWMQNETDGHQFSQNWPAEPVHNALVWDTEIADAYAAWLFGNWEYSIGTGAELRLEVSADGGDNWFIIAREQGPASTGRVPIPCTEGGFDLTPWAGSSILVRVIVDDPNGAGGYVIINDFAIKGKQDRTPPTASISLSGNTVGPGMYAGPVSVTITANDDNAMGEIHYILDGTENVVSGDEAKFTVSDDGSHTIEYWPVDATGNEGARGSVSFSIDNTPPEVEITAPEPGLYLFGNKLLSMNKPFIIGAFTAEAAASDGQGVSVVKFMLGDTVIGEDTEAPFDTYVAVKNMGGATLKVVAEDGVGNTAEDSMDITYYKFL